MRLEVLYSRHTDRQTDTQTARRTGVATDTVREGEGNIYREGEGEKNK